MFTGGHNAVKCVTFRACIAGFIKAIAWCKVMGEILNMDLPWRSLATKLARVDGRGMIEYTSTFDNNEIVFDLMKSESGVSMLIILFHLVSSPIIQPMPLTNALSIPPLPPSLGLPPSVRPSLPPACLPPPAPLPSFPSLSLPLPPSPLPPSLPPSLSLYLRNLLVVSSFQRRAIIR